MIKRCDPDGLKCQEGTYTGCCTSCGWNVYMSKEEYLKKLEKSNMGKKIKELEDQLETE